MTTTGSEQILPAESRVGKRLPRVLRYALTILLIVATPYIACTVVLHEYSFRWYRDRLPLKIAVDRLIFDYYRPGVRTDNAVGVLRISQETAEAIKREGLAFFENATTSRGFGTGVSTATVVAHYLSFAPWRETPFPREYPLEIARAWPALSFAREGSGGQRFVDQIEGASVKPGSFYTTRGRAMWFVSPELKYAVMMYW